MPYLCIKINDMKNLIPTYDEAVAFTNLVESPFYETVKYVDGYKISLFNYRLAQNKDFAGKLAREMRGISYVFNLDGSLFKTYILLEKFFNLNQVEWSMYSVIKDYKIKAINNKEDGSIASFIKLPNGTVLGKSKMSFDSDQAIGINAIYSTNEDVKNFVDFTFDADITAVFEYVSPMNRIVLEYTKEELILLKLRDNKTGKLLDISDYSDKLGSIKVAESEAITDLDTLIDIIKIQEDKEGFVILTEDNDGNDFSFKMKNKWYCDRHNLITNDLYREHILIAYVLDEKIDDVIAQIPEYAIEVRNRVDKIISVIKHVLAEKVLDIEKSYSLFVELGSSQKEYALKYNRVDKNFAIVMSMANRGKDSYELAKDWLRDKTKRLLIARDFLSKYDDTILFEDEVEVED
jgi:T4 RnlA family RNA ligase